MIRGIYTSASGMMAEEERNAVITNNLANVNTVGYKKDIALTKEFSNVLLQRMNDGNSSAAIGKIGRGATIDTIATVHSQGSSLVTGNPLDLAIDGKGYFSVETANGVRYTRNGQFTRSAEGELVTSEGYPVLGEDGHIPLGDANSVTITPEGRVLVGDNTQPSATPNQVGKLEITAFTDEQQLTKQGDSLYQAPDGAATDDTVTATLRQGVLEQSNVNAIAEMVNMINGQRAFDLNSKMLKIHTETVDLAVNQVGKV